MRAVAVLKLSGLIALFASCLLVTMGCAVARPAVMDPPQVGKAIDVEVMSESMPPEVVALWRAEVARRYDDAVVVFCHGSNVGGVWHFFPDRLEMTPLGPAVEHLKPIPVTEGIAKLRRTYGSRQLVLVTCNPSHAVLPPSVGRVAYSSDTVRLGPDKCHLTYVHPEWCGNVFEFRDSLAK